MAGRVVRDRLGGLVDEPRPGAPRAITDEQVEEVIVKALEATPRNATHWSTRSMAAEVGLSQSAVFRIWRTFGLKPHLTDAFKLGRDPQFIAKVRDVVGLYPAPPEHALVLCGAEKTQSRALDRSASVLPMMPGMPERRTHDHVRGGVTTLFAALHTATATAGTPRSGGGFGRAAQGAPPVRPLCGGVSRRGGVPLVDVHGEVP